MSTRVHTGLYSSLSTAVDTLTCTCGCVDTSDSLSSWLSRDSSLSRVACLQCYCLPSVVSVLTIEQHLWPDRIEVLYEQAEHGPVLRLLECKQCLHVLYQGPLNRRVPRLSDPPRHRSNRIPVLVDVGYDLLVTTECVAHVTVLLTRLLHVRYGRDAHLADGCKGRGGRLLSAKDRQEIPQSTYSPGTSCTSLVRSWSSSCRRSCSSWRRAAACPFDIRCRIRGRISCRWNTTAPLCSGCAPCRFKGKSVSGTLLCIESLGTL